jgi:hypothetical protein
LISAAQELRLPALSLSITNAPVVPDTHRDRLGKSSSPNWRRPPRTR